MLILWTLMPATGGPAGCVPARALSRRLPMREMTPVTSGEVTAVTFRLRN
jgi:hypothetical protein